MTSRTRVLCALITVFTVTSCASTFNATYDHDAANDFGKYESFAWISKNPMKVGKNVGAVNPLLQPRIMSALENALVAKGYKFAKMPKNADFVVSFTVGSREEIRVDSYPTMSAGYGVAYPRHWGWGGAYYGVATETQVRQYTEGMLAVDIFDVKERRPVWHGVATKRISESDREDAEATIKAAVDAILTGFPPP